MFVNSMTDNNSSAFKIDLPNLSLDKADMLQQLSDRVNDICNVKIAGRNLVQHRRKQKKVFAIDQRDLNVWPRRELSIQFESRVDPRKTSTKNDNPMTLFHYFVSQTMPQAADHRDT